MVTEREGQRVQRQPSLHANRNAAGVLGSDMRATGSDRDGARSEGVDARAAMIRNSGTSFVRVAAFHP